MSLSPDQWSNTFVPIPSVFSPFVFIVILFVIAFFLNDKESSLKSSGFSRWRQTPRRFSVVPRLSVLATDAIPRPQRVAVTGSIIATMEAAVGEVWIRPTI